jgi:hypothetical protein|tara:strand:+ start:152 stop:397 length:246 start_codon:yes stop_codon:yes gene_type:complete
MVLFFSDSSRSSDLFTYMSGIDPTEAFLELIYAPRLTGSAEEWFLLMRYGSSGVTAPDLLTVKFSTSAFCEFRPISLLFKL